MMIALALFATPHFAFANFLREQICAARWALWHTIIVVVSCRPEVDRRFVKSFGLFTVRVSLPGLLELAIFGGVDAQVPIVGRGRKMGAIDAST